MQSILTRKDRKDKRSVMGLLVLILVFFAGCIQQEPEKVPVIEVNFKHYIISDQHVVKINYVKKAEVSLDKVKITKSPPFPSVMAYAIYPKGGKIIVSPVAYTSINNQGDNISLYIGIEKDELPEPGTKVDVYVEVWSKTSKKLAADRGEFVWS